MWTAHAGAAHAIVISNQACCMCQVASPTLAEPVTPKCPAQEGCHDEMLVVHNRCGDHAQPGQALLLAPLPP